MKTDILAQRTTSAFALSVGTSLAMESIFIGEREPIDPDRVIPQKVNILDYQEFWINLSTLFRNIHGSITREESLRVSPREWLSVLEEEVDQIRILIAHQSNNRVKPIFYASQYQNFENKYPHARIRKLNTDNQRLYFDLHQQILTEFAKNYAKEPWLKLFSDKLRTDNKPKALLLSHIPYDLLSVKQFTDLHLIESHTGLLRKPATWYTKYFDGKNLPPMPFVEGLLQIFGDKEHFSVKDLKMKRELVELAQTCRWTPATTRDKILFDIDKLNNPYHLSILKEVM